MTNYNERLDKILDRIRPTISPTSRPEAKQAILALKQQWQLEARIEECEQLMALKWSVDERIAELEAQLTQSDRDQS